MAVVRKASMNLLLPAFIFALSLSMANCDMGNATQLNPMYRTCFSCSNFAAGNETGFQDCTDNTTCVGNVCFIVKANEEFPLQYFAGCLNISTTYDFGSLALCSRRENETGCVCNTADICNNWRFKDYMEPANGTFVINFNLAKKAVVANGLQLTGVEVAPNQNQLNKGPGLEASAATSDYPIPSSAECYKAVKLLALLSLLPVLHLV